VNLGPLIFLSFCLLTFVLQTSPHAAPAEDRFKPSLPGYTYSFPKDHGSHQTYRTEWWYYTGHLQSESGRTFGYQLTFFRSGMDHPSLATNPSRWAMHHLYLAHFAITDENKKQFFFSEKVNRAGIANAGADPDRLLVWNGGWSARGGKENQEETHHLIASDNGMGVDLWLTPSKPPVIHGEDGISKKGTGLTQASHYYSYTRMKTRGTLKIDGQDLYIHGTTWMDHEFGSNELSEDQVGWDWFGLQLDNDTELMLYQIRKRDGGIDPYSGGTITFPDGASRHLTRRDINIRSKEKWKSPKSGGTYPSGWNITIPGQNMTLTLSPTVLDQELITGKSTRVTYWEGSVRISGTHNGKKVGGKGYAELTGYAEAMKKEF
jgi:predicted secreted hydrolase